MLNIDQIEDQLSTLYTRRRALNKAAAALNLARAVAHLHKQFPTAAYAWADVAPAAQHVDGPYAADILRVLTATGEVLWDADDEDAEEIESPATDALVYAARVSNTSIPTHPGDGHRWAGIAPDTDSGADPALLVFAEIDKAAQEAVWSTEVTTAVVPQVNNGLPTLVLFPVPFLATYNREPLSFDEADAAKLGPPTVVGPDEFPGRLYDHDQVADAISQACDEITEHGDLGASDAESAMNVLLNTAMTFLDDPDADLHDMVERCYDGEYPRILADMAGEARPD
jgi:hypothetical protein